MSAERTMRLGQVSRKLNVGKDTIVGYLENKGYEVDSSPNAKITSEQYKLLAKEFASSLLEKEEAEGLTIGTKHTENVVIDKFDQANKRSEEDDQILITNLQLGQEEEVEAPEAEAVTAEEPKATEETKDKEDKKEQTEPEPVEESKKEEKTEDIVEAEKPKLKGIKVVGKIDLSKKVKKDEPKPKVEDSPAVEEKESKDQEEVKEEAPVSASETDAIEVPEPEVEATQVESTEIEVTTASVTDEGAEEALPDQTEPEVPEEITEPEEAVDAATKKAGVIEAKADKLKGLKVVGKIELPKASSKKKEKPVASSDESLERKRKKRPRKRIAPTPSTTNAPRTNASGSTDQRQRPRRVVKPAKEELSDKEIQEKIKATLAKLSGGGGKKSTGAKYRREKRASQAEAREEAVLQEVEDAKTLQVNEFISANDLANLIGVSVNDIISTCMNMGLFVSINQRLDAEAITLISDEFGFNVEFISSEEKSDVEVIEDTEEELQDRAPIVTIMGHVDHGKTSLLDYIRKTEVTATEAGGITQHIGAYDVTTKSGQKIAFLDTPGHEAFTAMRARGAKVTDVVIIVVAADDNVMPQTKEAINHAQVAGVPIVIAINKMDRPNANPEKIREELANMNILVEDWGGKYQCQEISAKTGDGIEDLLEKVLLEAELLELKANPDKGAIGAVIEASLDKGRGYVATLLVQSGTMKVGDVILAGSHFGRVKAMFDHTAKKLESAGPATPLLLLGLNGAPQAGDKFNILETEREAREIATKREQLQREQDVRTKKHITLDEIGRRLAIGSFKELNIIVKADVDGSIEALSDSLLKLSTEEVQVNIISKAVGQISESDVLLATAADGIIIGFQVRPSTGARKLAEQEQIEIRLYSIIYDAINEVKDAMEGMLAPDVEEVIVGNVEVRDVFKITRFGTVAGCMVTDGQIKRNNQVRLVRDGIVVYTGKIAQLKRFKEDVMEVKSGYECGVSIENFNDIKVGDVIESFEERETKRTL